MACSFDHEHMRLSLHLRRLSLIIVGGSEFLTLACCVNQLSQSDMHRCSSASMLCAVIGRCAGHRVFVWISTQQWSGVVEERTGPTMIIPLPEAQSLCMLFSSDLEPGTERLTPQSLE